MKLFSKLLLTFTLIASSAQATLDTHWLNAAQAELHEKLAHAIIHCDTTNLQNILNTGANPFAIHKTQIFVPRILSKLDAQEAQQILAKENYSPYYSIGRGLSIGIFSDKYFDVLITLLRNEISVDTRECEFTFREYITLGCDGRNGENSAITKRFKAILNTINMYQPEIKA